MRKNIRERERERSNSVGGRAGEGGAKRKASTGQFETQIILALLFRALRGRSSPTDTVKILSAINLFPPTIRRRRVPTSSPYSCPCDLWPSSGALGQGQPPPAQTNAREKERERERERERIAVAINSSSDTLKNKSACNLIIIYFQDLGDSLSYMM